MSHLANKLPGGLYFKNSKAQVTPVRQTTQYNCVAASMGMALRANGVSAKESQTDVVNKVMGCQPGRGASWEDAIACAQHYGMRATLVCPSTVNQLKSWTDAGTPVIIAWNPEGRPWSHASVVFDVDKDLNVFIADSNIPNPAKRVRVVPEDEFYSKWWEKYPDYLVRRPAMAVEREITSEGRQTMASVRWPPHPWPSRFKKGVQELQREFHSWVAGEKDEHDLVVEAYKKRLAVQAQIKHGALEKEDAMEKTDIPAWELPEGEEPDKSQLPGDQGEHRDIVRQIMDGFDYQRDWD